MRSPLGPGPGLCKGGGEFDGRLHGSGSGPVGGAVLQQSAPVWTVGTNQTLQQHGRRSCDRDAVTTREENNKLSYLPITRHSIAQQLLKHLAETPGQSFIRSIAVDRLTRSVFCIRESITSCSDNQCVSVSVLSLACYHYISWCPLVTPWPLPLRTRLPPPPPTLPPGRQRGRALWRRC